MKKLSLLTLLLATLAFAPGAAADEYYSVNSTYGAAGTITVDGANNGEWSEANRIALDLANDDPRSLGESWCMHETPFDLTHLYAAWDDEALYIAWQYVDVTDIVDPANAGSSAGSNPTNMDLIQWIAIDTYENQGAPLDMWGKNGGQPYWNGDDLPDFQIYLASNLWQAYISEAVDGEFPVDDGGVHYMSLEAAGIEVEQGSTLAAAELWGVDDADDALDDTALTEFVARGHDTSRDTFYEMRIPLSHLGLDRSMLESQGLGLMLGQGEYSCVDTIPNDPATSDITTTSDSNSPMEWMDEDLLSVDFARVAAPKSGAVDPCAEITCETGEVCRAGVCVTVEADVVESVDQAEAEDIIEDTGSPDIVEDTGGDDITEDTVDPQDFAYDIGQDIDPVEGQVSWSPASPTTEEVVRVYFPGQGALHWGVNGWQEPAQNYWPTNTQVATAGQAVESSSAGQYGELFYVDLGPFNGGEVESIQFVIHYADDTWDNNEGGRLPNQRPRDLRPGARGQHGPRL